MEALELARFQFAMTSIEHFLFVPVTIGLAFFVAILQTIWHRKRDPDMLRLTKFFGTLLLINIAIGVVTGLVQEFQFGMNWSDYSKFVGDVFGAPLAMEGLIAFFLESTFLGLWLFGWGRLPNACTWPPSGPSPSARPCRAAFIMAANSWMQNPVGYEVNSERQAELTDIGAVFSNPVFVMRLRPCPAGLGRHRRRCYAGGLGLAVRKGERRAFTRTPGCPCLVPGADHPCSMRVGSELGVVVKADYQPMKIAAAEAQWDTCQPCSFSAFQIGGGKNDQDPTQIIEIPYLLCFLATNIPIGQVSG